MSKNTVALIVRQRENMAKSHQGKEHRLNDLGNCKIFISSPPASHLFISSLQGDFKTLNSGDFRMSSCYHGVSVQPLRNL